MAGGAAWGLLDHRGSGPSTETRADTSFGASTAPTTSPSATVAPCATADLTVGTQPSTFGMNSAGQIFSVMNTGSSECAVPDHATDIRGQEADGTDVAIDDVTTMARLSGTTSGPLAPGGTAMFALQEGDPSMCSDSTQLETFTSVSLAFGPDANLKVAVPAADAVTIGCGGVGVTRVGISSTGPSGTAAPDVEASRTLPSQVVADSSMSYTVTLTNDSAAAVSLSPCPGYVAYMALTPGQVAANKVSGSLDCGGRSSIPAGGSISFDLSMKAPSRTGLTKVGWWVTGAAFTAQTGGAVMVTQTG